MIYESKILINFTDDTTIELILQEGIGTVSVKTIGNHALQYAVMRQCKPQDYELHSEKFGNWKDIFLSNRNKNVKSIIYKYEEQVDGTYFLTQHYEIASPAPLSYDFRIGEPDLANSCALVSESLGVTDLLN